MPRRLFWRFKAFAQRAVRAGDWKLLEIAGNSFLFDLAADPLERANLKERHRAVYDRLVAAHAAWEATMLPMDPESFTLAFTGEQLADHFGVVEQHHAPAGAIAADRTFPAAKMTRDARAADPAPMK